MPNDRRYFGEFNIHPYTINQIPRGVIGIHTRGGTGFRRVGLWGGTDGVGDKFTPVLRDR